jgi:hypothetical protein
MPNRRLNDSLPTRLAKVRQSIESRPLLRLLGGRGAASLALATALSLGGAAEVLENVHFSVEKNLDSVRVVRTSGEDPAVVATITDGFAGNSLFKLAKALPDRFVTSEISLFESGWIPEQRERNAFREEMARINQVIRRDFFANAIPYGDLIHAKSEKYDVDPALVAAVIEAESRFKKSARSQVGAQGLMQLMPRTGRWMGARDLYDPEQNVDAGVKYIKYLDGKFKGNLRQTIAAYNAGEGNVRRYGGVPPFRETQTYVKKVMRNYDRRNRELKAFEAQQRGGGTMSSEADLAGVLTIR